MHILRNFSLICACLAVAAECSGKGMAINRTGSALASGASAYETFDDRELAATHLELIAVQTPGRAWKARLFDEIPAPGSDVQGEEVILRPTAAAIRCEFEKGADFEIPFSGVQEITHEMTSRNLGGLVWAAIQEGYKSNTCSNACVYALVVAAVLTPFHSRAHYVTLAWRDGSEMKRAVFRLSRRNYRAFVEEVSTASGQPYRDLVEEQAMDQRELRRLLKNATAFRLDHDVTLGGVVLKRRVYKMLVTEDPAAGSVFALYAGRKGAVKVPVDVVAGGRVTSPEVAYTRSPEGDWTITEIRIEGKILRFASAEPNPPPDLPGVTPPDREY